MLGGFLVPYLVAFTKLPYIVSHIESGEYFGFEDKSYAVGLAVSMFLAITGSISLRKRADEMASKIDGV